MALRGVVVVCGGGGDQLDSTGKGELLEVWVTDGGVVSPCLHQLTSQSDVVWLLRPQQRLNDLLIREKKKCVQVKENKEINILTIFSTSIISQ